MQQLQKVSSTIEIANSGSVDLVIFNDWHPVAQVADFKPGTVSGVQLLGRDLVLWRGEDETIQAWDDRCPHRSVKLSNGTVVENTLVCPYHGMVYNTQGQCIKVPAHPAYVPPKQACAVSYPVQQRYGLVFVCLGIPDHPIAPFPEWEDERFVKALSGPHYCKTGGYRAIENFLDIAHFPFVHTHLLGDPAVTELKDYEVVVDDHGVHFPNIEVWQPDPLGTGTGAYVQYLYSAFRPLTAYLLKGNPEGECLAIYYTLTPVTEEECIGWMMLAMNYVDASQAEEACAWQSKIFAQDLMNLEAHNPKRLPLSPQMEFHVPCDRGSLAYRKWLKQMGVTYGVIL